MPLPGENKSRFCAHRGILLAADLPNEQEAARVVEQCAPHLAGVKLGNLLLYAYGPGLVARMKQRFGLPVVADIKLTDVGHIGARVAAQFSEAQADVVTVSGICGPQVLRRIRQEVPSETEIWLFTEFTDSQGLLFEADAQRAARMGMQAGAQGFQAPGNRPERVQTMRESAGPFAGVMSCGMGAQGGRIGSALLAGANFEIIGRWIYADPDPGEAAARLHDTMRHVLETGTLKPIADGPDL